MRRNGGEDKRNYFRDWIRNSRGEGIFQGIFTFERGKWGPVCPRRIAVWIADC